MRWASYAGFALLGGAWLVFTVWPAGRADVRARRVIGSGWAAMVFGGLAGLVIQGPDPAGQAPWRVVDLSLLDLTLHTASGQLHSVRLLLLGALAVLFGRSLQPGARASRTR